MSTLAERMMKAGRIKDSSILSKSKFLSGQSITPTKLPILNIAFSGKVDGGLTTGITILSGDSKTFKTLLSLYCLKAYFDENPDAICLFYDSEFGFTEDYLVANGIDPERVIHIPVMDVEELKLDVMSRLDEIQRGDKVFVLLDSLGALASKKETDDARDGKSVTDMSRAKAIRSFFRIITPRIATKDLPCMIINHVYVEIGAMYPKTIIPGGTAVTYSANQIFVITKSQEKDGTELEGYKFTINIHKSRYVKEKSKLPFKVLYDKGIMRWSSMFDLALESGFVEKVNQGWYTTVDPLTGEVAEGKKRAKEIENDEEFFESLIENEDFKKFVSNKFRLESAVIQANEEELAQDIEEAYDDLDEE